MSEQLALLPQYLTAHLQLTLVALLLGMAISVPTGVAVARVRWLEHAVLGLAGVIQTIPSLALLAVMVPILAALHLPSIGYAPAIVALVLYSTLPILRNTVAGLATIDAAVVEAARGVGMTPRQQLLRVELPLAMPVIIAGVRTATVWTVGVATLSTPVGAPSLGNFIFSGLQTRNLSAVTVGCVAAAALALLLDALIRMVAVGLGRGRRGTLGIALAALAVLYVFTGATLARGVLGREDDRIVVGAKTFTEQYILGEIIAGQLRHETSVPVEVTQSLGSTVVFDALCAGEIDVYVDYSGTIWATIMRREATASRAVVLGEVERFLRDRHGILLVGSLGFQNSYALAMRRDRADALGVRRISDLIPHAKRLSIGGDYEFLSRQEWRSIRGKYKLAFRTQRSMDSTLMYQAAAQRNVDVISAFSTDGRIAALDLVVLEDDRGAIPPYDAVILASARLWRRHPKVVAALRALVGKINEDAIRRMNLAVDQDGRSAGAVAREFLRSL